MEYGGVHDDSHAPSGCTDESNPSRGRWVCRQCDQYSFDSYYDMIHHERTECPAVARQYQQPQQQPGVGGVPPDSFPQPYSQGQAAASRSTPVGLDYRSGGATRRVRQPQDVAYQHYYDQPQYFQYHATPLPEPSAAVSPLRRSNRPNIAKHPGAQESAAGSATSSSQNVAFSPAVPHPTASAKPSLSAAELLAQRPEPLSNLLTLDEMNTLSEQDRMLCQSIAIFLSSPKPQQQMQITKGGEASNLYEASHTLEGSEQAQPQPGKAPSSITSQRQEAGFQHGPLIPSMPRIVGFQCVYCSSSRPMDDRPDPTCVRVFPGSVETLGSSLYLVKERHFRADVSKTKGTAKSGEESRGCPYAPEHVMRVLQQTHSKGTLSPEQRYHETMMLQTVCNGLAYRLGIINNFPYRTGVILDSSRQYLSEPGPRFLQPPPYQAGFYESPSREDGEFRGGTQPPLPYGSSIGDRYGSRPSAAATASTGRGQPSSGTQPPRGNIPPTFGSAPDTATRPPTSFFYDGYGWSCPNCVSIPYHMRAPGSFYRDPPSAEVVERHLSVCTGATTEPWTYERGMPPPYSYPPGYQPPPYPGPPAYYSSPSNAPPPPGWREPPPYFPPPPYVRPEFGYPPFPPSREARPSVASSDYYYPPIGREGSQPQVATTDASFQAAIKVLSSLDEIVESSEEPLVLPEDKLLLTDYFYFVNKQLKLCRFTESDRKTRGGKRETIEIGFGGLECRHCAGSSGSRKFFWSDVDRLANSFAEIPAHILKCRKCPENVKQSLADLKQRHPEQMARLPRGSQKVFFRRMWKRLHNTDIEDEADAKKAPTAKIKQDSPSLPSKQPDVKPSAATVEESDIVSSRPASTSQVLLSVPQDSEWLSDFDCSLRKMVEVFHATRDQVDDHISHGSAQQIKEGQIGIKCACCSRNADKITGDESIFPASLESLPAEVRKLQDHFEKCPSFLEEEREAYIQIIQGDSVITPASRKYYVAAAKTLGLFDSPDGGIECQGGQLTSSVRFPLDTSDLSRKRPSSPLGEADKEGQKIVKI